MDVRTRMSVFLSAFIGACAPRELDDTACLYLDLGETCPSAEDAAVELKGDTTCESPQRKVVKTGELVESGDIVFTPGYGSATFESGDTGQAYTKCCYEAAYRTLPGSNCVIGRPLVRDGAPTTAALVERGDWRRGPLPRLDGLTAEERAHLADVWANAALIEHASIPAFARLAAELVALGGPGELLARAAAAMADEVRHAEASFAIASAYAGRALGPSALAAPPAPEPSLVRLAAETFREGCVGESLAVALAAAQLRDATDPAVRAVLMEILVDERRHAELAWDVVRWALAVGGDEVRAAIAAEADGIEVPRWAEDGALAAHGLAAEARVGEVLAGMLAEVVRPAAAELLAA